MISLNDQMLTFEINYICFDILCMPCCWLVMFCIVRQSCSLLSFVVPYGFLVREASVLNLFVA